MTGLITPGTCRNCGCTDEHACEGGCFWVDSSVTLCSQCYRVAENDDGDLQCTPDKFSFLGDFDDEGIELDDLFSV